MSHRTYQQIGQAVDNAAKQRDLRLKPQNASKSLSTYLLANAFGTINPNYIKQSAIDQNDDEEVQRIISKISQNTKKKVESVIMERIDPKQMEIN